MERERITKYCPPTKLDMAPFGTIWHVIVDRGHICNLYIQMGEGEAGNWERLGIVLERMFDEVASEESLIQERSAAEKIADVLKVFLKA